MYEEYMQSFLNYPVNGYRNTYDQIAENYPYSYSNQNRLDYHYHPNFNYVQNRNSMQMSELENCYPEIYKVVYPMVKKVCLQNSRSVVSKEVVDSMVEEVYSNLETNDAVELNITVNNEVRNGISSENKENRGEERESKEEKRQIRRNTGLNDLIRILILRELLGRPGCIGPNCNQRPRPPRPPRPNPGPWNRPPFPRYDFEEMEQGGSQYFGG